MLVLTPDNIIFTIKETKLYVPVVALSAKDNQKVSKLLNKGFEIWVYWNRFKTKSKNENTTNEYRYFAKSNFVGVNGLFGFVYSNVDVHSKRYKVKRYYLPKGIIKNYNFVINGKKFYDQAIGLDIKRYEQVRKLTPGQGEHYRLHYWVFVRLWIYQK